VFRGVDAAKRLFYAPAITTQGGAVTGRPTDDVWDALEHHFGPVRTQSERGRRNLAVRELREAGALKEEIAVAYRFCAENFTTFTELALAKHFSRAQHLLAQKEAAPNLSLVRKMTEDA
jgi:hypothetical protein